MKETHECHNSQCASFYKTSAEKLGDIYEMAFSILETLHCFKLHWQHSQPGFCAHSNYTVHQTGVEIIVVSSIHEHTQHQNMKSNLGYNELARNFITSFATLQLFS